MSLTANRELNRYVDQELRSFGLAANVHIYKGAFVGIQRSSGYVRPLVAGDLFVGVAYEEMDNTGGSAGDKSLRVYTQGDFIVPVLGVDQTTVGAPAYALDDTTLTLSPAAGGSSVGKVVAFVTDSTAVVRIEPMSMPLVEQSVQAALSSVTGAFTVNPVLIAQRPLSIISLQVVFNTKPDAGTLDVGTDESDPDEYIDALNLTSLTNNTPAAITPVARAVAKGARIWAKVSAATAAAGKGGLLTVRFVELP